MAFRVPDTYGTTPAYVDSLLTLPIIQTAADNGQGGLIKEIMQDPIVIAPGSITGSNELNVDAYFGNPVSQMTDVTALDFNGCSSFFEDGIEPLSRNLQQTFWGGLAGSVDCFQNSPALP